MAPVDPTTAYLISAFVIVLILAAISLFCGNSKKKDAAKGEPQQQAAQQRVRQGPPGAQVRRRKNRMQLKHDDSDEGDPDEVDDDDILDEFDQEGKIGAKKLRKLQDKAEKKRQREIELEERAERKERERKLEALRKKEEERQKAKEEAMAEDERLKKEEQEKQEHEEYLKMKEMFTVEEEGVSEQTEEDSQMKLQQFIDYIQEMKVVMLEELASHFNMKTQDCINRIHELQSDGRLTGVIDDRGKFIYITVEELESVAKYIRQHGRVSISELAESSNRLINLNPDNADIRKKLIIGEGTHQEVVGV